MYKNDPFWMTAKFGQCSKCKKQIKGKRVFYYPKTKTVYCEGCGEQHSLDFDAACFDEMVYNY